jgi:arabinan endo-1,5-alpha-L-arabinosidase
MKKLIFTLSGTLIAAMFIVFACGNATNEALYWTDPPSSADTLYQNPLFEPDLADPSFVRAPDGWFYAYGTENDWATGVHRITPIVRSKTLTKWEYVGDAFAAKPTWKSDGGIWAPQIVYRNGTYYLYYSFSLWGDSNPGVGLATSAYPYGPFKDEGKVLDAASSGVGNSIDQYFIEVGSGRSKKFYLFWGSFRGIYGIEMSDDMKTTVGAKFQIAGDNFEATYIHPKDGKFYFFGSTNSCCEGKNSRYRVTVAVASSITGPYKTKAGVDIIANGLTGTPFLDGSVESGWVGPGHNSEIITDDHGRDFILYHAIDYTNDLLPGGATRRPLMMDEVLWVDGWPTIAGGVPSNTKKTAPYFNK